MWCGVVVYFGCGVVVYFGCVSMIFIGMKKRCHIIPYRRTL